MPRVCAPNAATLRQLQKTHKTSQTKCKKYPECALCKCTFTIQFDVGSETKRVKKCKYLSAFQLWEIYRL